MVSLTPLQVRQYYTDGFLVLRASEHDLVSPTELQEWTHEVANWPLVKGKWMPYDEVNSSGQRQLMRTEKFADYHEKFASLLFGDAIADILKQLSGDVGKALDLKLWTLVDPC
jgi:hypothetical protein